LDILQSRNKKRALGIFYAYLILKINMPDIDALRKELEDLDKEMVDIDGNKMKPSQCYWFGTDPVHMLFNTNCPDSLKQRLNQILSKYLPDHEADREQPRTRYS